MALPTQQTRFNPEQQAVFNALLSMNGKSDALALAPEGNKERIKVVTLFERFCEALLNIFAFGQRQGRVYNAERIITQISQAIETGHLPNRSLTYYLEDVKKQTNDATYCGYSLSDLEKMMRTLNQLNQRLRKKQQQLPNFHLLGSAAMQLSHEINRIKELPIEQGAASRAVHFPPVVELVNPVANSDSSPAPVNPPKKRKQPKQNRFIELDRRKAEQAAQAAELARQQASSSTDVQAQIDLRAAQKQARKDQKQAEEARMQAEKAEAQRREHQIKIKGKLLEHVGKFNQLAKAFNNFDPAMLRTGEQRKKLFQNGEKLLIQVRFFIQAHGTDLKGITHPDKNRYIAQIEGVVKSLRNLKDVSYHNETLAPKAIEVLNLLHRVK